MASDPLGLDHTATVGIVSALDRQIELEPNGRFIQTDASINPGNSGGPLINRRGQAIGINTVIFTRAGGSTGIGFAIPTRFAEPILARLATEGGRARTGSGARNGGAPSGARGRRSPSAVPRAVSFPGAPAS